MLETMPDSEFGPLYHEVVAENHRRMALATIPLQVADLNREFLGAQGTQEGEPWRQPTGAHDAFPLGWTVTHAGSEWVSLVDANVWMPPLNWRQSGGCPQWVQPTGAHDVYNIGDCVTFEGGRYISLIDSNAWSPADHPAGWEPLEGDS